MKIADPGPNAKNYLVIVRETITKIAHVKAVDRRDAFNRAEFFMDNGSYSKHTDVSPAIVIEN